MQALLPAGRPHLVGAGEVDQPAPRPGQAVIRVEAFSVNRGETFLLEDPPPGWRPGKDIAGRVTAAAADGSGPAVGARVVAHPPSGGWAQYAVVDTGSIAELPLRRHRGRRPGGRRDRPVRPWSSSRSAVTSSRGRWRGWRRVAR